MQGSSETVDRPPADAAAVPKEIRRSAVTGNSPFLLDSTLHGRPHISISRDAVWPRITMYSSQPLGLTPSLAENGESICQFRSEPSHDFQSARVSRNGCGARCKRSVGFRFRFAIERCVA